MNASKQVWLARKAAAEKLAPRELHNPDGFGLLPEVERFGDVAAAPRKVMVTDRRVTVGRKISAAAEFPQVRHEWSRFDDGRTGSWSDGASHY